MFYNVFYDAFYYLREVVRAHKYNLCKWAEISACCNIL